jgi:AcrR family transcriptional regulator
MDGARGYSTVLRAEQTELTRSRVLAAGAARFAGLGYQGTTVAGVAADAAVSVQTVYNVVGGKADLLRAACERLRPPGGLRAGLDAAADAPDATTCLNRYAAAVRESDEYALPLICLLTAQAAAGDPDLATALQALEDDRAAGTNALATHVHAHFGLRPGLDVDTAADILWALTAPETADRLTRIRGWGWDRFEAWLGATAGEALLGLVDLESAGQSR